jgi:hypothetical protein
MKRRNFLASATGATLAMPTMEAAPKGGIIELRQYEMRNSAEAQPRRINEFIEKHAIPAGKRAGVASVGVFSTLIGPDSPTLLMVNVYPSLAAMEAATEKLSADEEFQSALGGYYAGALPYLRVNTTLLRAIDSLPGVDVPAVEPGKAPRVFELRTYESNTPASLRRKVGMFEAGGELAIFRRVGMHVVFFGTIIAGANQPSLVYMLGYDNWAHREKCWSAFLADPEWHKLRDTPGLSDAEIVSNVTSVLLRPAAYSPVK